MGPLVSSGSRFGVNAAQAIAHHLNSIDNLPERQSGHFGRKDIQATVREAANNLSQSKLGSNFQEKKGAGNTEKRMAYPLSQSTIMFGEQQQNSSVTIQNTSQGRKNTLKEEWSEAMKLLITQITR
eukprot:15325438-Ditylum_brightwellii.AAC.1